MGAVQPESSGHTGLIDASHRSNQCKLFLSFARVNVWVNSLLSRVATVSPAGTGLTGGAHRPDRCRSVRLELVFHCVLGSVKLVVGS
jgi:hypothetical protein